MGAVTSIMRAQQVLVARLNDVLKPFALTFPRYEALMALDGSDGALALSRLGEQLQVHKATVTSIVDRLEDQGLVERVYHQRDRRTVLARITADGRRVADDASIAINAASFGVAEFDTGSLEALYELLTPMRAS